MGIRAIIFDLGGVIVRTEDKGPRTRLAESLGMTYHQIEDLVFNSPHAEQAGLGAITAEQHWQWVCQQLGLPTGEADRLQAEFWGGDRLDQGLVDYIRSLRPRYRTALLSNAMSDTRPALRQKWQIEDAFGLIVISAEVKLGKPDPRVFQIVVDRLGIPPQEAVFVDDFPENIAAACQSGLQTVQFKTTEQAISELDKLLNKGEED
jgi:epoxide hydrolase-like predicted phosphatase